MTPVRALCLISFLMTYSYEPQVRAASRPTEPSSPSDSNLVLMSLSAHPDDEDGATLAYYAKIKGVKTYSLFFTRGEGGQNEIGAELNEDLGAIRTKETLEAAKILASEVYFLGYPDFGFSKTAKETFAMWGGKDSILARLVYYIRALKPDLIISNYDTVTTRPNSQHGNHQAVGITAFEAFEKAADPTFHSEQIRGPITAWQVQKLYSRFYKRDSLPLPPDVTTIDVEQRIGSGQTIEELAISALQEHRSQGLGRLALESIPPVFRQHAYRVIREHQTFPRRAGDLFSGIRPAPRQRAQVVSLFPKFTTAPAPNAATHVHAVVRDPLHLGFVRTYDDAIEHVLTGFHIPFQPIDSVQLADGDLSEFSTIILDLRAYFYRHDLPKSNRRLLEYVRSGGNVVCFYHKPPDWNGKDIAPFPITLTGERVTEENAQITILNPSHPFFVHPNQINDSDWAGWTQERSVYLPSDDTLKTSARYERLLSMSDEDEHQPSTSLLWATYGKGTFTYCSLVLYRQLKIFNGGAIKLLFNMISQPRN